jgi:hypothetical protein
VRVAGSWSLLVAIVVGVLAVVGLICYLLAIATDLERSSALLLAWTGAMVWSIGKRRAFMVWLAAGQWLLWAYELVSAIAEVRDWPASHKHEIAVVGDWLDLPELACALIALVVLVWYGSSSQPGLRSRFRSRSSPASER